MRTPSLCLLAVLLACAPFAAGGQDPPKLRLHIPFDGTPDAEFSANGQLKTSYIRVAYRPGVKAQGAQFGSRAFPCGLVVDTRGIIDMRRGSIEFWYMPLQPLSDTTRRDEPHTLVTDGKPGGAPGHFWMAVDGASLVCSWQARRAEVLVAAVHRWKPETWHHIVATWDGESGIELYIDGERVGEKRLRWVLPPLNTLYIGANRYGGARAEGLFDGLKVYDRALKPTEVELAVIHNLQAEKAPEVELPSVVGPVRPAKAPRVSFHLTFNNIVEAQTAMGNAKPVVAKGVQFQRGLSGQALVCGSGLRLAYELERNLSKEAGAISFWARALPGTKSWRGVLLADGVQTSRTGREQPGSLGFWLDRDGTPWAHFTLWPKTLRQRLVRWDGQDWHHLAACWRRGDEVALYVNGRQAGRAKGARASWSLQTGKRLSIGSWDGRLPANALIDDLRFYSAPLSSDAVKEQASEFLLPFVLQLGRTLYERGSAGELVARFYNIMAKEVNEKITVRVVSPDGKRVANVSASLEADARERVEVRLPLTADMLATDGLYQVTTAAEGRVASPPRAYFLVVAPEPKTALPVGPPGPEPKLGEAQTVDVLRAVSRQVFCQSGGARIVRSPLGSYREAGAEPGSRFAYLFSVPQTGVPYLATVTYPADRQRSAEIIMNSRRYPGSRDVATGYFVDRSDAAKPHTVDLPIYFWPREKENAIIFCTLEAGQPAACARITIQQLAGPLPPAPVEAPQEGGRSLGAYWSDPAVPLLFGARSGQAPDVYESFRRLIDYLYFTGQDVLNYPVAWHNGVLYPSQHEEFRLGSGAERHVSNWLEYVLYLCERRGIRFIPEIVFDDCFELASANDGQSDETVAAGVPTARMVTWDGSLSRGGVGDPPRYNPIHPTVHATLLQRVSEIVETYGKSPALGGVSVHLGPSQSAWFASIQCGYGDYIISEFEKEGDFQIPEGRTGPTRFADRARWLLANKRDVWVAWRCRKLRQVFVDLASRLQSTRPGLTLYLNVACPVSTSWHPRLNVRAWDLDVGTLDRLYREAGLDLASLTKRPANLVVRKVLFPTDRRFLGYRFGARGPSPSPDLARDFDYLSEGAAPLLRFPRSGAVCSYRQFTSGIGVLRPMPGLWWKPNAFRASLPTPAARRFLEPCVHAVAELDVTQLVLGGGTLATAGHEPEFRAFARAFRALPPKRFLDVPGLNDPVCGRELHDPVGHFLYLANRTGYPVEAYVAFEGKGVALRDLVAGTDLSLPHVAAKHLPAALPQDFLTEHLLPDEEGPLPDEDMKLQAVTGSLLHVRLQPYELRSYRSLTKGTRVNYAAARTPAAERLRLAQRIQSAKSVVEHSNADPEIVGQARSTLQLIARAWNKRELSRVERLLDSYSLTRLR